MAATERFRATGQVGKVLGERWKALNMKQREPYEAKAKTDKQRYEDEKASYNNVSLSGQPRIDRVMTNSASTQTNDDDEDEE